MCFHSNPTVNSTVGPNNKKYHVTSLTVDKYNFQCFVFFLFFFFFAFIFDTYLNKKKWQVVLDLDHSHLIPKDEKGEIITRTVALDETVHLKEEIVPLHNLDEIAHHHPGETVHLEEIHLPNVIILQNIVAPQDVMIHLDVVILPNVMIRLDVVTLPDVTIPQAVNAPI
jgi:hypothetical protein